MERHIVVAAAAVNNSASCGEQMVFCRYFSRIALGLAIALFSGCASTRIQTVTAADRLAQRADSFVSNFCAGPGGACRSGGHLPAAGRFAEQTHEFRRAVENDSDQQVVTAFKNLWLSYHALRNNVCRVRNARLRAGLTPTARAFAEVQVLVENGYSYADPTVYAMGGYTLDPYYN